MFLLFLIFALILVAIFAHMTLYVAGSLIGILVVLVLFIIKRRRSK